MVCRKDRKGEAALCTTPKSVRSSPACRGIQKMCGVNPRRIAALVVERKKEECPPVSSQGSLPAMKRTSLAIDPDGIEERRDHPLGGFKVERPQQEQEKRFVSRKQVHDRSPDFPVP